MTTLADTNAFAALATRLEAWRAAIKRRCDTLHRAWIDQHFRRQREARERYLSRARDPYELERLEREFDRSDSWRVY